jgi:glycosyltransferase involved in cell wall biosynthesis
LDLPIDALVRSSVSLFITGSRKAKERLHEVLRLRKNQVVTFPNGIKPGPILVDREQLRATLGLETDDIAIGIVALLEWRKGHRYLIESFSLATQEMNFPKNAYLLIEGDGPEKDALRLQIKKAGLEERVKLIGKQQRIFEFYKAIDILAFSSIAYEDFPNVILEGMSMALPIVATRIAGVPEQIENGANGILVNPRNVNEMKTALERLVENRELRSSLGLSGYKKYTECFSAEIAVGRYLSVYDRGIAQCNGGDR